MQHYSSPGILSLLFILASQHTTSKRFAIKIQVKVNGIKRNKLRLSFHFFNIKVSDKVMNVYYRQKELTRNKIENNRYEQIKTSVQQSTFYITNNNETIVLEISNPAENHQMLNIYEKTSIKIK